METLFSNEILHANKEKKQMSNAVYEPNDGSALCSALMICRKNKMVIFAQIFFTFFFLFISRTHHFARISTKLF